MFARRWRRRCTRTSSGTWTICATRAWHCQSPVRVCKGREDYVSSRGNNVPRRGDGRGDGRGDEGTVARHGAPERGTKPSPRDLATRWAGRTPIEVQQQRAGARAREGGAPATHGGLQRPRVCQQVEVAFAALPVGAAAEIVGVVELDVERGLVGQPQRREHGLVVLLRLQVRHPEQLLEGARRGRHNACVEEDLGCLGRRARPRVCGPRFDVVGKGPAVAVGGLLQVARPCASPPLSPEIAGVVCPEGPCGWRTSPRARL